jgi:hypothetical protein
VKPNKGSEPLTQHAEFDLHKAEFGGRGAGKKKGSDVDNVIAELVADLLPFTKKVKMILADCYRRIEYSNRSSPSRRNAYTHGHVIEQQCKF